MTFEHCLRGLFHLIEGGLTVEQVIGKVADRARIAERVEEKLGDLPHQATVGSWVLSKVTPQSLKTFEQPLHLKNPGVVLGKPRTLISCTRRIGQGLREQYGQDLTRSLPHELSALLMQLSEKENSERDQRPGWKKPARPS
jgi:hypothetical protein